MTFDVEIGGRSHSVVIETAGGARFRVTVDGHSRIVDAVRLGDFGLSLVVGGEAGASHEAQVVPSGPRGETLVWLDGRIADVSIDGRRGRRGRGDAGARSHGMQSIVAPMPGRVVRILVAPGDEVAARQAVVVVEAMKMENELRAPKAGRVKDVSVAVGSSVEAGRVLSVVE
jgi:biotin carboxyl carrier protein